MARIQGTGAPVDLVTVQPYGQAVSDGLLTDVSAVRVSGFNGDVDATLEDLWTAGGAYAVPTAAMGMKAVSGSDNDTGTSIFDGTADSVTATLGDDGQYTVVLVDEAKDFEGGTAAAAGDHILLHDDKVVVTVTEVTDGTTLTGTTYDSGVATSAAIYDVVDYSAASGAQAVRIDYLDSDYLEASEFVMLNGTTAVATAGTSMVRINGLHVVAAGSGGVAAAQVDLRHLDNTPIYRSIPAGYNDDADAVYTVPSGKTMKISEWQVSAANGTAQREVRAFIRADVNADGFIDQYQHVKAQVQVVDGVALMPLESVLSFPARSTVRLSALCTDTDALVGASFTGWVE